LYAPTFRDNTRNDIMIDYQKLKASISNDYVLLIKRHPRLNTTFKADVLLDFVYDVSAHQNINELLTAVDILITDYSSLPFEFALLHRPMIFYVPDLDTYSNSRGLWEPLAGNLPGPITKDTDDLIWAINHISINQKELNDFNLRWNTYSVGQSSNDLVDVLYLYFYYVCGVLCLKVLKLIYFYFVSNLYLFCLNYFHFRNKRHLLLIMELM